MQTKRLFTTDATAPTVTWQSSRQAKWWLAADFVIPVGNVFRERLYPYIREKRWTFIVGMKSSRNVQSVNYWGSVAVVRLWLMDTRTIFAPDPQCWRRFEMKAIVLTKTCSAEELKVSRSSLPWSSFGLGFVKIRAFRNQPFKSYSGSSKPMRLIFTCLVFWNRMCREIENPSDSSFTKG